jgi:6,7-dimethyl-8-ribityllumazine synthase
MRRDIAPSNTIVSGRGRRFAVVTADFNPDITGALRAACVETLRAAGAVEVRELSVPGAFELPLVCDRLARTGRYQAVIALGCVIRGETPHDRYISHAAALGIARAAQDTGVPVIFGVLTPLNEKQARARATGRSNKGREAAVAALAMAGLFADEGWAPSRGKK